MPTNDHRSKNLVPLSQRSPEERKRIASQGGKKAHENAQRNKTMRAAVEWALQLPAIKGCPTVDMLRKKYPGLTNQDALAISIMAEGILKGNVKAFQAIQDTIGESPTRKLDVTASNFKIEIEEVE